MAEDIIRELYKKRSGYKGLLELLQILQINEQFKDIFIELFYQKQILPFGEEEFMKIESQNIRGIDSFITVFEEGLNLLRCTPTSKQLSYSYDGADLVSGQMQLLGEVEKSNGGTHCWMEYSDMIYDTTLMLKINKKIARQLLLYEEAEKITSYQLNTNPIYLAAKDYATDRNIRKRKN